MSREPDFQLALADAAPILWARRKGWTAPAHPPRGGSMRRLTLSAVAFAFTLLVPSTLHAQNAIVPFIGGGLARGVADLADNTSNGWLVLGGFDLPMDD